MVRAWTRYSDRMRESPYHESNLKIEEHYTDTAGFTDHEFALGHLLGFRFALRIRDLADRRIYVPEKGFNYPAAEPCWRHTERPANGYSIHALLGDLAGSCPSKSYQIHSRIHFDGNVMVTQAFLYNTIFFTYPLILVQFYNVPAETVSVYLFPFAFGNLLGPILLGGLFDSIGRKTMITLTYATSRVLLALTDYLFRTGVLTAEPEKGSVAWRRKGMGGVSPDGQQ